MILRHLSPTLGTDATEEPAKPASKAFLNAEKQIKPPCGVVLQAEHCLLAGQIAELLDDRLFGELPPAVIQAIAEHDFGWQRSDQAQIEHMAERSLRPFSDLTAAETMDSWNDSTDHGKALGPLQYVLISRHFCLLGASDPARKEFVDGENRYRTEVERSLPYSLEDLDRWTAAIGFCDLVSLYLCSGTEEPVLFPFAHPADPAASHAPKTLLCWHDGRIRFDSRVVEEGSKLNLESRSYKGNGTAFEPLALEWVFE